MYHNIGKYDRLLRLIFGLFLMVYAVTLSYQILMFLTYMLAILLIVTGVSGWSPLYAFFDYSSRSVGISKIRKEDIADAVKKYPVKVEVTTKPKTQRKKKTPKQKAQDKKDKTSKVVVKKVTKSLEKKDEKKIVKKVSTKKKTTKPKKKTSVATKKKITKKVSKPTKKKSSSKK